MIQHRLSFATLVVASLVPGLISAQTATAQLKIWLQKRPPTADVATEEFANQPLSKEDASRALDLLWADYVAKLKTDRVAEISKKVVTHGDLKMKYAYSTFGEPAANGRSLFISMHGGGGAPARVNDQQWENQKRLYSPEEGVYLAPRAPTNTWNLWHQRHIDPMFERIIQNLVATESVDPNRVYLMGYSAGGDGVYQVAPRMADRFAAASMMAGHPNEASPYSLRNLPFAIHVGALDAAYKRNTVAREWGGKIAALQKDDEQGYEHTVTIHANKGHWMDRQDAVAVAWMAAKTRNPVPARVVWQQDDITHRQSYWLALPAEQIKSRGRVDVTRDQQTFLVSHPTMDRLTIRMDDRMIDCDKPITVLLSDRVLFEGRVQRTIATLAKTLAERGDRYLAFSAEVTVDLKE